MTARDLPGGARLMLATLGFLRLQGSLPPVLHALHRWLDSWRGIGIIERGTSLESPRRLRVIPHPSSRSRWVASVRAHA